MDPQHPHKQSLAAYFCNHSVGREARAGGAWGLVSQMANVVSSRFSENPCLKNKMESGRGIYVMDSLAFSGAHTCIHTYVCMYVHTYLQIYTYTRTYIQHSVKYSGNSEHRQKMQEHSEQATNKAAVQLLGCPLSSQLSSSFQSRGSGWDRDVTN